MEYKNYEQIIQSVSNPDTMADGIVQLTEQLRADEQAYNNLVQSVNSLRDTNARLALRITNPVNEPDIKQPTNIDLFEDFVNRVGGKNKEVK